MFVHFEDVVARVVVAAQVFEALQEFLSPGFVLVPEDCHEAT